MITVTISECKGSGRVWQSRHRTDSEDIAIDRALARHWGQGAGFHRDNGLRDAGYYGQVTRYLPGAHAETCLTGRVRIATAR